MNAIEVNNVGVPHGFFVKGPDILVNIPEIHGEEFYAVPAGQTVHFVSTNAEIGAPTIKVEGDKPANYNWKPIA